MDATIERTRRHLAEAEADVARLRAELAEAEKDVANLNRALEHNLEQQRQEELVRLRREREESVAARILRELRELDGGRRFRGPRRMTMSSEEFRRRRAELNNRFRARTEPHRLSSQELSDRHTYLKIFVDEIEEALDDGEDITMGEVEELEKAKAELESVSAEYFKNTAWNLQPGARETPASPKRTFRSGGKGLGGGRQQKRTVAPPTEEERRQDRIESLQRDLQYLRNALQGARNEEQRQTILEQISEMSDELQELLRADRVYQEPLVERARPSSPMRRTGKKGLAKRSLTDAERREKKIDDLKEEIEYYEYQLKDVDKRKVGDPEELRREFLEKIHEKREKLEKLLAGGPVNSCIECHGPHQNMGRSFCGSECQRTFLLAKMKI